MKRGAFLRSLLGLPAAAAAISKMEPEPPSIPIVDKDAWFLMDSASTQTVMFRTRLPATYPWRGIQGSL